MDPKKKWYDYPRPIPFDELQQRIMVERYRKEHQLKRDWQKKYRMDTRPEAEDKCFCAREDDPGWSQYVCPPTTSGRGAVGEVVHLAAPVQPPEVCKCPSRFRELKWPPECKHVCSRMGFDCWMC